MNPECNVTRITAAGNNYRCNRSTGHSGEHRRTNANGTYVIYRWPQEEPPKPQCAARHQQFYCTLPPHHTGSHEAWGTAGTIYHRWPATAGITTLPEHIKAAHPSMFAKGGWVSGRGYGKTALLDEVKKLETFMDAQVAKMEKAAASLEEELKNLEETPVLLTLEELTAIAYYMPPYTDDKDDVDNTVKDKVYAALKKML